jgi:hypothetical protein
MEIRLGERVTVTFPVYSSVLGHGTCRGLSIALAVCTGPDGKPLYTVRADGRSEPVQTENVEKCKPKW